MKVICLCKEDVQDKYTNQMYLAKEEYGFTEERAEEVLKAHGGRYFKFVRNEEEVPVLIPLEDLSKEELVELAKAEGLELDIKVKKAELIEAINKFRAEKETNE